MSDIKISVIIPVYNALEDLKKLIKSLDKNFNFLLGDITLINDCSNEETTKYLQELSKSSLNYKVVHNEENFGFIKTCNKGMKTVSGDIVVLLNSDTEIPSNFAEKIIDCFESDNNIGVASPISSSSISYSIPLPKGYTIEKMNCILENKHKTKYPLILAAEGFCFCIRRDVIAKQGYLDEVYGRGYHEEIDFALRAITNGWRNVLIDNLYVYHKHHASFTLAEKQKLLEQNDKIFKERWMDFINQYRKENKIKNPIEKIFRDLFPLKGFIRFLFSFKTDDSKIYIRILGIKTTIRKFNKCQ